MPILKQSSFGDFTIEGNLNCSLDMKLIREFLGDKLNKNQTDDMANCGVPANYWWWNYASDERELNEFYKNKIVEKSYIAPEDKFKPTHIVYNDPVTVCFFPDGSKVMVRCAKDEKYIPENDVMACIVNKIFGNRTQFLKVVKAGYQQPTKKIK